MSEPTPSPHHLAWVATGGTIAGRGSGYTYTAGALSADRLADAWQLDLPLPLRVTTPYQIDSKEAGPSHWQQLHTAVAAALATPGCQGVVVTHGTDTLEESAALLALTLPHAVPVVLTGAMRPADDPQSDGATNFRFAASLLVAAKTSPGVWVAFAGKRFPALGVRKIATLDCDAFTAVTWPPGETRPIAAPLEIPLPFPAPFPTVPLIPVSAWDDPNRVLAAAEACAAIVLLCPGHGSLPHAWHAAVRAVTARGIPVVRASRCPLGPVLPHPIDDELGTWPAGVLGSAQARVAAAIVIAVTPHRETAAPLWRAIACAAHDLVERR
ncbi:asparaginase [Hydrogenophilus islandicus]